jgi:hypothetical protein
MVHSVSNQILCVMVTTHKIKKELSICQSLLCLDLVSFPVLSQIKPQAPVHSVKITLTDGLYLKFQNLQYKMIFRSHVAIKWLGQKFQKWQRLKKIIYWKIIVEPTLIKSLNLFRVPRDHRNLAAD